MGRSRRVDDRRFLLDVADLLSEFSTPPGLPAGWHTEIAVALADDAALGGDFTAFDLDVDLGRLRSLVVDTSGKGAEASSRAVMLAGAVSGLIAELGTEEILPAVNRRVAKLGSDEHFATAVLTEVNLRTGDLQVAVAGHPSPARFDAGSGRWVGYDATGPVLGFIPDASWEIHEDQMRPADALIVVTDGVVEVPGLDVDTGIDRLLGQAEHLVLGGWVGGACTLLEQCRRANSDDAQVWLLARGGTVRGT